MRGGSITQTLEQAVAAPPSLKKRGRPLVEQASLVEAEKTWFTKRIREGLTRVCGVLRVTNHNNIDLDEVERLTSLKEVLDALPGIAGQIFRALFTDEEWQELEQSEACVASESLGRLRTLRLRRQKQLLDASCEVAIDLTVCDEEEVAEQSALVLGCTTAVQVLLDRVRMKRTKKPKKTKLDDDDVLERAKEDVPQVLRMLLQEGEKISLEVGSVKVPDSKLATQDAGEALWDNDEKLKRCCMEKDNNGVSAVESWGVLLKWWRVVERAFSMTGLFAFLRQQRKQGTLPERYALIQSRLVDGGKVLSFKQAEKYDRLGRFLLRFPGFVFQMQLVSLADWHQKVGSGKVLMDSVFDHEFWQKDPTEEECKKCGTKGKGVFLECDGPGKSHMFCWKCDGYSSAPLAELNYPGSAATTIRTYVFCASHLQLECCTRLSRQRDFINHVQAEEARHMVCIFSDPSCPFSIVPIARDGWCMFSSVARALGVDWSKLVTELKAFALNHYLKDMDDLMDNPQAAHRLWKQLDPKKPQSVQSFWSSEAADLLIPMMAVYFDSKVQIRVWMIIDDGTLEMSKLVYPDGGEFETVVDLLKSNVVVEHYDLLLRK